MPKLIRVCNFGSGKETDRVKPVILESDITWEEAELQANKLNDASPTYGPYFYQAAEDDYNVVTHE